MYLKQFEWAKWAAVDEMRRAEAKVAAAIAAASVATPATPLSEADDEAMDIRQNVEATAATAVDVLPSTPKAKAIPPVTPGKHVSTATARARAVSPLDQPRKTPVAKRTASIAAVGESDDESGEDELNALPVLSLHSARPRSKTQTSVPARTTTRRVQPASEQRPTRVTRSTATSGVNRRLAPPVPAAGKSMGPSPNKIPRLAQTPAGPTARSTTSMSTRARVGVIPPTPSRLPTLVAGRRGNTNMATTTKTNEKSKTAVKRTDAWDIDYNAWMGASTAWVKANSSAVVVPGTKSERPGLRSVRRRRSSFSAADVVA